MRRTLLVAAAVLGTAFIANTASAQADWRHGFGASVGVGYGSQSTALDEGGGDTFTLSSQETTWYGQASFGMKPHWTFGVEFNYLKSGCSECGGDVHFTNSFYSAAAAYYPSTTDNFFIKLNLGYATNAISESGFGTSTEGGFAAGLGFGYDWAMGKGGFIVKPFANYMAQVSSAAYSGGDFSGEKGRSQILQVGVGLGFKH